MKRKSRNKLLVFVLSFHASLKPTGASLHQNRKSPYSCLSRQDDKKKHWGYSPAKQDISNQSPASSGPSNNDDKRKSRILQISKPDPFVAASAPIVAAVCSDGVVLVAVHNGHLYEPLLMPQLSSENYRNDKDIRPAGTQNDEGSYTTDNSKFQDLPPEFYGAPRITSTRCTSSSSASLALAAAGWRTDGETLSHKLQSLAMADMIRYGGAGEGLGGDVGRSLAHGLALYLAHAAASDSMRALSCAALLADGSSRTLHLVDASGSHRVRALALGLNSQKRNDKLVHINFAGLSLEEGIEKILGVLLLSDEENDESDSGRATVGGHGTGDKTVMVEVVTVDCKGKFTRRRQIPRRS